jgi:2,4-diketo-3-deoxy-L-fuconate hydrolase
MRLARIGDPGRERPAILRGGSEAVFVDDVIDDWGPDQLAAGALERVAASDWAERDVVDVTGSRFGSPLSRTTKIVCIGLNYTDHAAESGMTVPEEPIVFMKAPDCLCGPNDPIVMPPSGEELDYEAELAVVIGATALYLHSPDDAKRHILGYSVSQDFSERAWQLKRGGQWVKGKSFPTFNPLGPVIRTADEFDPTDVAITCSVDGGIRQAGRTSDMIFKPEHLVWYVSQFMRLLPGDVINTGTPAGVGLASAPAGYLSVGQTVVTEVEGIGSLSSKVISHA